jgi:hypothetical protein
MEEELVRGVELITERRVLAFMSANHLDPDMAAEILCSSLVRRLSTAPPSLARGDRRTRADLGD